MARIDFVGDGEINAQMRLPAVVHGAGETLVSRRGLATTLAGLDTYDVRLVVEGPRLALRTPAARFSLAQLDAAVYPRPVGPPPLAGTVPGSMLRAVAVPVAGAASRGPALPVFTGVRIRARKGRLSLVATDRFRMAVASVPWQPADGEPTVDVLVPAALLAEVVRQAGAAETVAVHGDGDRFALAWGGGTVATASLGSLFPDRQIDRLLDTVPECVVEVAAEAVAGAVERAAPYCGPHGRLAIDIKDGLLLVRGSDPSTGESEEAIRASVRGNRLTRYYQARYLLDALRPFAGTTVQMQIQAGIRATVFTAAHADAATDLTYLVVPMTPHELAA